MTETNEEEINQVFNVETMHTMSELGTSVPAFLGKLWKLVEDPETDDLICWAPNGRSFFIRNQAQFARELLPHYYKHNNMASFVRQLNMYGFHKKVSVELGGLKCDRDEMEFAHQYFCKGHAYLLDHIKRKIATSKIQDASQAPIKPELMTKMLTEVRSMRGRQEHLDSKLGAMKRENEALWRELAVLRQKHLKQQQIVSKLIHFLVTLVQPSRGGGLSVKRRYPLMIDDSNRQRSKQSKLNRAQASPAGPVIHELDPSDHDLDSQYIVDEILENQLDPTMQNSEYSSQPIVDEDASEVLNLVESVDMPENIEYIPQEEGDSKKKKSKGKKKRKNNVPIKILIPSTKKGEESREETIMLEIPEEEEEDDPRPFENKSKSIPLATVRSSKLAAMAANLNSDPEVDAETELNNALCGDIDDLEADDVQIVHVPDMQLDDILIIPEMLNENNIKNNENNALNSILNSKNANNTEDGNNTNFNVLSPKEQQLIVGNKDSSAGLELEKNNAQNGASTSTSSDNLSLSCINTPEPDGMCRLGSLPEQVDNHLDNVQSELDNLRDILRGEGYSIDANTLLGLFGNEDPMSYGIPMNPDLNPNVNRDKEDELNSRNTNNGNRGELMAYNPSTLLDFDDVFMNENGSQEGFNTESENFNTDPLELESKNAILDSLISANNNNQASK
ncbi:heat shock factor protein isoform X1 [Leptopilina heterotoma]|uniref:heat shock factor protein isoform X1 n=1 Tax=Leptopilina heterotoma TaxID=63436 RepID=UPI001CA94EFC|nr:heat shock factor protein isoform X1 [Leptopilina heterotoma]